MQPGTHQLGPASGSLVVRTTCEGAMARMGHDLTIAVDTWDGELTLGDAPEACAVAMRADLRSLRVIDSRGGAKPPAPGDHDKIRQNAQKGLDVARHPELGFVSREVTGAWDDAHVVGDLTLHGRTETQRFDVRRDGEEIVLTGEIVQSRYGLQPFSAMMGALRLADAVAVEARVRLAS